MSEEELKNKMDTFIECYKNGMIFGAPTDIEFYEKIATLQQKVEQLEKENDDLKNRLDNEVADGNLRLKEVEQLENIRKEAIEYIENNSYFESNIVKTMVLGDYSSDLLNILNKGSDKNGNNTNETSTRETEK